MARKKAKDLKEGDLVAVDGRGKGVMAGWWHLNTMKYIRIHFDNGSATDYTAKWLEGKFKMRYKSRK